MAVSTPKTITNWSW